MKEDEIEQLIWSLAGSEYPGRAGGETLDDMRAWFYDAKEWEAFFAIAPDGELVGHVRFTPVVNDYLIEISRPFLNETALMEVTRLFTHPDYRSRGIAEHLLRYATQYLQDRQLTPILRTADYLYPSHRLYRRLGWEQIGWSRAKKSGDRLLVFIKL